MEVLTKTELRLRIEEVVQKIKSGKVFIHPTDTIYGLGCNALDAQAVNKIRKIKERYDTPFSVWVPSTDWIKKNCVINKEAEEWLKKLPGPYTLILKLKDKNAVAANVNPQQDTIGVRIPDHWFSNVVRKLNAPIVTTSANKVGRPFMIKLENIDKDLELSTEFLVYEGEKNARPSKIIDLVKGRVIER